ncbi:MAG: L,D-transpeptidase family protein [Candidatus Kaiserbacteria bacterium]|nr:L,D-transpeptidase family protein [Candidatus Kaiserbacteria bacterium]
MQKPILENIQKIHKKRWWILGTLVISVIVLGGILLFFLSHSKYDDGETGISDIPEIVIETLSENTPPAEEEIPSVQKPLLKYVEVTDGCDIHFEGECLRVRGGPGVTYPIVARLRNGMVLRVGDEIEQDGILWYKIIFDEWLQYPERVVDDWYIASEYVKVHFDEGDKTIWDKATTTVTFETTKKIVVDRSEQKLYAYDDEVLFMEVPVSTGLILTPTPRGSFTVFKKTPSRYMQGPLPGFIDRQYYDLPGVPWNLYFTQEGAVIHGAYWHNSFGKVYSHGCVNLLPENARKIYEWADLGTHVIVQD